MVVFMGMFFASAILGDPIIVRYAFFRLSKLA